MGTSINRVKELEDLIRLHKALYYQGRPKISDLEFDKLENELREVDPSNPVLNIVGTVVKSQNKVKHSKKMLSLDKTYSINDLKKWVDAHESISMYKIDGVSCSLIYKNGNLKMGKTRGDGSYGEDITEKIKWNTQIPLKISFKEEVEIRGELYCCEDSFFHLSEEMIKIGLDKPTSQRNIVAGLIGRKDNVELNRFLSFQAFDVISDALNFTLETEKFEHLKDWSFNIPSIMIHKNTNKIQEIIDNAAHFMSEGNYQIDGLVFCYNPISLHDEMGETAHHPRYKMAFKFQGESKVTTLKEIEWSISRNGILTPVGLIEPVELSGAKISRVTLHNYGLVKQYNLKAGDKIEIIRSGEVIPKFLEVISTSDKKFDIPLNCPSCDYTVEVHDIRLICPNPECSGKNKEVILNFIQKIGIEAISKKRIEEMINKGLVKNITSLYQLKTEDFLSLDKVKDKLANKFYDEIQKSKTVSLIQFLGALGVTGGAYNKCEKIVNSGFNTIEKVMSMDEVALSNVESFAEKSATDFITSLQTKKVLINELISLGFVFANEITTKETAISGLKICITGELSTKRSEVEKLIKNAGGIIVSSVSKNTNMLLTNETESKSSKFKKAISLGIKIISEKELQELI